VSTEPEAKNVAAIRRWLAKHRPDVRGQGALTMNTAKQIVDFIKDPTTNLTKSADDAWASCDGHPGTDRWLKGQEQADWLKMSLHDRVGTWLGIKGPLPA
jgi:hypothetical protein